MMQNPFDQFDGAAGNPDPIVKQAEPYRAENQGFKRNSEMRAQRDQQLQEQKVILDRQKLDLDRQKSTLDLEEKRRKLQAGDVGEASEGERKNAAFYRAMLEGHKNFTGQEGAEVAPSLIGEIGRDYAPDLTNILVNSPERQKMEQAKRAFIRGTLRMESGAAIGQDEFDKQDKEFFPQPGDSPEVIEQKRKARLSAIEGMRLGAGRLAEEAVEGIEAAQAQKDELDEVVTYTPDPNLEVGGDGKVYDKRTGALANSDGYVDGVMRDFGAGVGDLVEAVGDVVGIVSNPLNSGVNALFGTELSTDMGQTFRDASGLPESRNPVASAINQGGVAALSGVGLANAARPIAQGAATTVTNALAKQPISQGVAGAAAGGSAETASQMGAPLPVQIAAGIAGGVAGFAGASGARNALAPRVQKPLAQAAQRQGINVMPADMGGTSAIARRLPGRTANRVAAKEVAENRNVIQAAEAEGIPLRQPDVRPSLRDAYGGVEATQVGGPIIQRAAKSDAEAIANRLDEIGGGQAPKRDFALGEAVQDAVNNEKDRLSREASALYRRVDMQAPGFAADASRLAAGIDEQINSIKAVAPKGNEDHIARLERIKSNFSKTGISTETIQANRDIVRQAVKKDNLAFTRQEVELLDTVAQANNQLEQAMAEGGNDAALSTLRRANQSWREYTEFKRDVVKKVSGTNNSPVPPETAAKRLVGMVSGDSVKFKRIYRTLPDDERQAFRSLVVENLGAGRNGEFGLGKLATALDDRNVNWRSLREVFGADGVRSLRNIRTIARAKTQAMQGKNFSNTTRAAQNQPFGFGTALKAMFGFSIGDVTGAALTVGGSNFVQKIGERRAAKMLLNSDFTRWLKDAPNSAEPRVINGYLSRLDRIKGPAITANIMVMKDFLREAATQSPSRAAAADNEGDGGEIPPS